MAADSSRKGLEINRLLAQCAQLLQSDSGPAVHFAATFMLPSGECRSFYSPAIPPSTRANFDAASKLTNLQVSQPNTWTDQSYASGSSILCDPQRLFGQVSVALFAPYTVTFKTRREAYFFIQSRFQSVQQLAVKAILKAFIKAVEPRKKSRFSYVAGKRPCWWPNRIAFQEPDHLHTPDRIDLAVILLSLNQSERMVNALEKEPRKYARTGSTSNGWVEMLRGTTAGLQLAFSSESPEKSKEDRQLHRESLLRDIFAVALVLEQIHWGERAPEDMTTRTEFSQDYSGPFRKVSEPKINIPKTNTPKTNAPKKTAPKTGVARPPKKPAPERPVRKRATRGKKAAENAPKPSEPSRDLAVGVEVRGEVEVSQSSSVPDSCHSTAPGKNDVPATTDSAMSSSSILATDGQQNQIMTGFGQNDEAQLPLTWQQQNLFGQMQQQNVYVQMQQDIDAPFSADYGIPGPSEVALGTFASVDESAYNNTAEFSMQHYNETRSDFNVPISYASFYPPSPTGFYTLEEVLRFRSMQDAMDLHFEQ